ncbi:MAG TPA: ScpA family protein [Candidatus Paceibacterota bacterium]
MSSGFAVKTASFEGPLEALLEMVERKRLSISDVSLATVADEFIAYSRSLPELPMGEAAQFVFVASTLLLIKSRSLLPGFELSAEEEQSVSDLAARLRAYQALKNATRGVARDWLLKPLAFRSGRAPQEPVFAPALSCVPARLLEMVSSILRAAPKLERVPEAIVRKIITIEEAIRGLAERVRQALKISFREFAGVGKAEKVEVVVRFLALLELVKQGTIHARQGDTFGEIHMETTEMDTPKYA